MGRALRALKKIIRILSDLSSRHMTGSHPKTTRDPVIRRGDNIALLDDNITRSYSAHKVNNLKYLFIAIIRLYQLLASSFRLSGSCRFYPTCSNYCLDAVKKHNIIVALLLSIKRIVKCNPWGGSGIDLVPVERKKVDKSGQSDK